MRMPFTCTSSLSPRPPDCGKTTCHTRWRRSNVNSLSQVTPHTRTPNANSTVTPTWISVLRLMSPLPGRPPWRASFPEPRLPALHRLHRTLARAFDELPHQRVARLSRLLGGPREHDPAAVEHRHAVRHL